MKIRWQMTAIVWYDRHASGRGFTGARESESHSQ